MKNKSTHSDYTINGNVYQLFLPLELEVLIPKDDSVRLLSQKLEELDYTKLNKTYSQRGRKPAVSPMILMKIMVYAYMNGIYTSRGIEQACRRDINFMWLLQGRPAPDHNTIARFRTKRLSDASEELFSQFVEKLYEQREVAFENIFIDGTKIEANANKYTFVWRKAITKSETKIESRLPALIERLNADYSFTFKENDSLASIREAIKDLAKSQGIEFVSGKGKRKSSYQRDIEILDDYIDRLSKYDSYNAIFDGRNSFSKTDTDATFMHMKDDHMRNAQLKPDYNVQIGVEGEYIIGIDVSSERSDQATLVPFLKRLESNFPGRRPTNIIADAGYESEENYLYLAETGQTCYIKPANYERSKSRRFKSDMYIHENMLYDPIIDEYRCPNGKQLKPIGRSSRKSKSGFMSEFTIYECESCKGYPQKTKCTKAAGNRRLSISRKFVEFRKRSLDNIISNQGILLRMNRSIQVEGAFGVIKYDYGFQRFLTRGKKNVRSELLLLGFGYNMNKLHNKIQEGRCGHLLHVKEIAA